MVDNLTFLYDVVTDELPVSFLNCGHELVTEHSYRWNGSKRGVDTPYIIWQYTLAGCGAIKYDGQEHLLKKGDAFLVAVPDEHVYYLPESSDGWEFIYLTIVGRAAVTVVQEIQKYFKIKVFHTEPSAAAGDVIAFINRYKGQALPGRFQASAIAYNFLMQVAGELYAEKSLVRSQLLADKLIAFLQKNTGRSSCEVEDAAVALGFSRTHFTRLFKAETGMSPAKFMLDWRLRLAARIITSENCLVKEVAWRSGFSDPSHFCNVFRRKFGCTPEEFRCGKR